MTIEAGNRMNLDGIRTPEQFAQEEANEASMGRIKKNIEGFMDGSEVQISFWLDTLSVFRTLQENYVELPHTVLKTRGEITWVKVDYTPESWKTVKKRFGDDEREHVPAVWKFNLHANSGEGANQAEFEFSVYSDEPNQPKITESLDGKVVREGIHSPSDLKFVEVLTETVLAAYRAGAISPSMIAFEPRREN